MSAQMNDTDVEKILSSIEKQASSNVPVLVLQGVTLTIMLLKPVLMYWIQAKYKAPPPHESIRAVEGESEGSSARMESVNVVDRSGCCGRKRDGGKVRTYVCEP